MNTFKIEWLEKQGLHGSAKSLKLLSDKLESILELRVGYALADKLSDKQIAEFELILSSTDDDDVDDERINWLEKNYPAYKKVVKYQKNKLVKEIRESDDKSSLINKLAGS